MRMTHAAALAVFLNAILGRAEAFDYPSTTLKTTVGGASRQNVPTLPAMSAPRTGAPPSSAFPPSAPAVRVRSMKFSTLEELERAELKAAAVNSTAGAILDPVAPDVERQQEVIDAADQSLGWIQNVLRVLKLAGKSEEVKFADDVVKRLRSASKKLKKQADRVRDLADLHDAATSDEDTSPDEPRRTWLTISGQAEHLRRMENRLRRLRLEASPAGAPREFVRVNGERLTALADELDQYATTARAASGAVCDIQSRVEAAVPLAGIYATALVRLYLDLDQLSASYASLASQAEKTAKNARSIGAGQVRRLGPLP